MHLTISVGVSAFIMKKQYKQFYKYSDQVIKELEEAEQEFNESIEEQWESLQNRSSVQRTVMQTAQKIKNAKKIMHVFGDIPRTVH